MKKLKYQEGDWFSIPLTNRRYARGIVARTGPRRRIVFGYFFGPALRKVPTVDEIESYTPSDALLIGMFGDLSLILKEWPIIGQISKWYRSKWPMPNFARHDEDDDDAWEVVYSEDNPAITVSERRRTPLQISHLPEDCLMGAGYVEIELEKLISEMAQKKPRVKVSKVAKSKNARRDSRSKS